jgi:hypothetical protein
VGHIALCNLLCENLKSRITENVDVRICFQLREQSECSACLSLQLRVDLLDFSVSEPDANGFCINDYLEIAGGTSSVPRICGENTNEHGKHVYLPEWKACIIIPGKFEINIIYLSLVL